MSFLWEKMQPVICFKRPSPKHSKMSVSYDSIKRTPLFISFSKKLVASMTVEAAIVLPLFLFFFLHLGSAMEMMRLHGNLQLALWDTGNRMCVYGYAAKDAEEIYKEISGSGKEENRWWNELADVAFSYTWVKAQIVDYVGEKYLDQSPLTYGSAGLQFWESELFAEKKNVSDIVGSDDVIEIVMTYEVSPWGKIPVLRPFRMSNRYYGHLWTGYGPDKGDSEKDGLQDVVYITENASVYHVTPNCTHLKLTIREVTLNEAKTSRNEEGKKYKECSKCGKRPFTGTVFIGKEGDSYHYDRNCSGLKRTVRTVTRQEAAGLRPCSRCAAK